MYQYDQYDQKLVEERVQQYRQQTARFLDGKLTDEQFRSLRLMNGLYIQTHAPLLRVSIPYGLISSRQLRKIASISRDYDKGYVHFTTRQNVQFNWPALERVPDILAELSSVQMQSIQSSGNCIRNVTSDHFAGICADEVEDPRPWCEMIRQWSTFHPEFTWLPRKFKIAVTATQKDRAATQLHDIGLHLIKNEQGEVGFEVLVGGGLGRTPVIGKKIRTFLEKKELLAYLEAILRVYNRFGRRDNKFKARIKILVNALGAETFTKMVEEEWQLIRKEESLEIPQQEVDRMKNCFTEPAYETFGSESATLASHLAENSDFSNWYNHNTAEHKVAGYRAVILSLKAAGVPPGDVTEKQLDAIAELAEQYSFGLVRSLHTQNLAFADVQKEQLFDLWQALSKLNLATANIGTLTDIICCPGLDFCSLANTTSIPIAKEISERFDSLDYLYDLGDIKIRLSGCMNGCAHQSVGHIGILGVDKKGAEWYQITLGGSSEEDATLGARLGPAVSKAEITNAIETIISTYVELRQEEESFLQTVKRTGVQPFKEKVYAD
jgi:sulfite reductase (NADPH) hemoprotein beta-component